MRGAGRKETRRGTAPSSGRALAKLRTFELHAQRDDASAAFNRAVTRRNMDMTMVYALRNFQTPLGKTVL